MVFFLYGADTFRSRQKLNELEEKFVREVDPSGANCVVLEGARLQLGDVRNAVSAMSMFVRKRMVIVERLLELGKKDVQEDVTAYLQSKEFPEENIVVFWEQDVSQKHKSTKARKHTAAKTKKQEARSKKQETSVTLLPVLLKQQYVQEFPLLEGAELTRWVRGRVSAAGGTIAADALQELMLRVGSDAWRMEQEIAKLAAHNPAITHGDVAELVSGRFTETIFALTDAIGTNNQKRGIELIQGELDRGTNHLYLLTMIVRQVRMLLMVRESLDHGATEKNVAATLGLHPFVASKATQQAGRYTFDRLREMHARLFQIERDMKSTTKDPLALFTAFIAAL